jgi:hypothetical protein
MTRLVIQDPLLLTPEVGLEATDLVPPQSFVFELSVGTYHIQRLIIARPAILQLIGWVTDVFHNDVYREVMIATPTLDAVLISGFYGEAE